MNETETWFAMPGSRVVFHDANICFRDRAGSFKSVKQLISLPLSVECSDQKMAAEEGGAIFREGVGWFLVYGMRC